MESATDLVENATANQMLTRVLGHVEAGRVALDEQGVEQGGHRELRRTSETAVDDVVVGSDSVNELPSDRTGNLGVLLNRAQVLDDCLRGRHHFVTTLTPRPTESFHELDEPRQPATAHRRKVGSGKEWLALRSEEHGIRPPTLAGHRQGHLHQRRVDLGALLSIDLNGDDIGVDDLSHLRVAERLQRHNVAPVAARVAH